MFYILGHMFYTFVDSIDFVGNLVQASMKFHEEVGVTEVVSKLETGNVSLPSHSERHLSNHIPGTSPGQWTADLDSFRQRPC
jgi:hypothetical protein